MMIYSLLQILLNISKYGQQFFLGGGIEGKYMCKVSRDGEIEMPLL